MPSFSTIRIHPGHEVADVKRQLLAQGEQVCRRLLPAGKRMANEWVCGDLHGTPGHSLKVNLTTGVWKDFATGEHGSNLLEFWRQVRGTDFATAMREAAAYCGMPSSEAAPIDDEKRSLRDKWPPFLAGTHRELFTVAKLRGIAIEGIEIASERGLLRFALWRGAPCWIVTDSSRANAQARRLDGYPFVVDGRAIKAITLPGSHAGLPLGLSEAKGFPAVAVVEGGPDLLAAHACMWAEGRMDVGAVAVLGASHRPTVTTWSPLSDKKVRVYCHRDEPGMAAAAAWGKSIHAAGAAKIDGFKFDGLQKVDGSPVTDLNDLLDLHPDDFESRRDVWEILP